MKQGNSYQSVLKNADYNKQTDSFLVRHSSVQRLSHVGNNDCC